MGTAGVFSSIFCWSPRGHTPDVKLSICSMGYCIVIALDTGQWHVWPGSPFPHDLWLLGAMKSLHQLCLHLNMNCGLCWELYKIHNLELSTNKRCYHQKMVYVVPKWLGVYRLWKLHLLPGLLTISTVSQDEQSPEDISGSDNLETRKEALCLAIFPVLPLFLFLWDTWQSH